MIKFSKKKLQNTLFLGPFYQNLSKNKFSAKSGSYANRALSPCKKSEKNNESIKQRTIKQTQV